MERMAEIPARNSLFLQVIPDFTAVPAEDQHMENLQDSFFIDFSYTHVFQPTERGSSRIPVTTFNDIFMVPCDIISICHQQDSLSPLLDSFGSVPLPSQVVEAVLERVVACGVYMLARNNVNGEGQSRTLNIDVDLQVTSVPVPEEESGSDQLAHVTAPIPVNSLRTVSLDDDPECAFETCSICLEMFEESAREDRRIVRMMRCSHMFHEDCIIRWLSFNFSCPYCRQLP